MSSTFGKHLKLSIFGQSHSPAIGMTLDGIPAGLRVDEATLQAFLDRRAPGQAEWTTARKESDKPEFLSGIVDGYTCGAPIAAIIRNEGFRSEEYANIMDCPRPGHADFTAQMKYGGFQDNAGGGHFSGRLTAPLCIAGGLCKQWLEPMGVRIGAHILQVGHVQDSAFDPLAPELDSVKKDFAVLDKQAGDEMKALIQEVQAKGDSVSGEIECAITGLPVGLGEPMFGGVENRIAQIVFGIPAVKGLHFGDVKTYGSENNDAFTVENSTVKTLTNHAGGILGGIANGMPVIFRATFKPTPSIALPQKTVSLSKMVDTTLAISGRHDPCIVPRAVPVVEAAAAIAIYDMMLGYTCVR